MRAIGPPLSDAERARFIEGVRSLKDVRWRHQGRDERGVDCAGAVVYALRYVGRPVRDAVGYGRVPYRGRLETLVRENLGGPFDKRLARAGDVPLMRFQGDALCHCGVLVDYPLGGLAVVHAYAANRKVIEHRVSESWWSNIIEVYRP